MESFVYEDEMIFLQHCTDISPDSADFPMHAHEYPELVYIISGDIMFWAEGTPYCLSPHDFMLFNAAETHKVQILSPRPYERVVLQLKKPVFSYIDKDNRLLAPFTSRKLGEGNLLKAQDFTYGNPEDCILKMINRTEEQRLAVFSYLLPLLYTIYVAFSSLPQAPKSASDKISAEILRYVNENITLSLSPESIAKRFFISRTALYSLFKETAGCGVTEYINIKRLLMAKEKIISGEKPTNVFGQCGFNDYSVFFRAYKKRFGLSPKADFENRI